MSIGKLEEVELRSLWQHEARDFTTWLAQSENLEMLSEEIGIPLFDPTVNERVGKFFCDMVCKVEGSEKEGNERTVVIENQLEQTDHDHLGKLIAYASGVNASCIIWIAKEAREEHISAIQWLNSKTDSDIGFFLIEIKAFRIGDSLPAPQFRVVVQPNAYSRSMKPIAGQGELKRSQTARLEFWENFNRVLGDRKNTGLNVRKASTNYGYSFSLGTSQCRINAELLGKEGKIRVGLWIPDNWGLYDFIASHKDAVESRLQDSTLNWFKQDGIKVTGLSVRIDDLDFNNPSNYDELAHKIIDTVIEFKELFVPIVNSFKG